MKMYANFGYWEGRAFCSICATLKNFMKLQIASSFLEFLYLLLFLEIFQDYLPILEYRTSKFM